MAPRIIFYKTVKAVEIIADNGHGDIATNVELIIFSLCANATDDKPPTLTHVLKINHD